MDLFKKFLPHLLVLLTFLVIALSYYSPVLEGKGLRQQDIIQHRGEAKEIYDFRDKTGEEALWTNSQFGGMPAYMISVMYPNNWAAKIARWTGFNIPVPARFLLITLIGSYIMFLCFGLTPWLSFAGSLVYSFSTYFFIISGVGHNTKMLALAFMAPMIGGVYLAYAKKWLLGSMIFCAAFAAQLYANHLQVTYYTAWILAGWGLFQAFRAYKDKAWVPFLKTSGMLVAAAIVAISMNITNILLTLEYTPYSTRGKSELTSNKADQTGGLDKTYILNDYSYGKAETFNLFIPNFMGGPSVGELSTSSHTYNALIQKGFPKTQAQSLIKQMYLYWGGQRVTSGPVYIGAIAIFLFVLGLFLVKSPLKWWLGGLTLLSILLAWGKNFQFFSELFINYFPLYNKFRTVSMILVIAEFTIPLLGILALKEWFSNKEFDGPKKKALLYATAITGGFALIFALIPGAFFSFQSPIDQQVGLPDWLITALQSDREVLLRNDALRSLIFVCLSAGLLWAFIKDKLNYKTVCVALCVLFLFDLWPVNKRFINNDAFVTPKEVREPIKPTAADLQIMQDPDPNYRVFNVTGDPFSDATTSYFHKSIGGYHGAKMERFQEIIEYQISRNNMQVLNMLNTKYFIVPDANKQPVAQFNPAALGNAWMVDSFQIVGNADEEMAALTTLHPANKAVIDGKFSKDLEGFTPVQDSTARVELTSYLPNHLTYSYESTTPQCVVFSEIYYPEGWDAFVDGVAAPHFRADYILRAMVVPAGQHTLEFRFEPPKYIWGERIALAGSLMMVLLLIGSVSIEIKKLLVKNK